jgi:hypothetical protein
MTPRERKQFQESHGFAAPQTISNGSVLVGMCRLRGVHGANTVDEFWYLPAYEWIMDVDVPDDGSRVWNAEPDDEIHVCI